MKKKNEKKFEKTKIFCYGTLRDGTRPGSPVPSRCVPGRDGTGPKVGGTMRDEDANSKMRPGTGRKILPGRVPDPSLLSAHYESLINLLIIKICHWPQDLKRSLTIIADKL